MGREFIYRCELSVCSNNFAGEDRSFRGDISRLLRAEMTSEMLLTRLLVLDSRWSRLLGAGMALLGTEMDWYWSRLLGAERALDRRWLRLLGPSMALEANMVLDELLGPEMALDGRWS